jgi:hypothetical protein
MNGLPPAIGFDVEFDSDGPLPPTEPELIGRLLPATPGLVCIVGGQSGAGKSFYTVGISTALASGTAFLGHPCRERVGVIYVAAEGASTIKERVFAAKLVQGIKHGLPIAVIKSCPDLMQPGNRAALIVEINRLGADMIARGLCERVGAVFIDSVTVAFVMENENDNSEVVKVCGFLREIGLATETVTVPVHHFGKDKSSGLRGASAWRANCDHCIVVLGERDEQTGEIKDRAVSLTRSRIGAEGMICCFELENVALGLTRYGEPRTTCVFKRTVGDPSATVKNTAFDRAFEEAQKNENDDGKPIILVRMEFVKKFAGTHDAAKQAWGRALKKMCGDGGSYFSEESTLYKRVQP